MFPVNTDTMSPGKVRHGDRGDSLSTRKVRTPQSTVAANGCLPQGTDQSNRDEPTLGSGETGNLYGEQHQIGNCRSCSGRLRVDGLRQGVSLVLDEWSSAERIFQNIIRLIGGLLLSIQKYLPEQYGSFGQTQFLVTGLRILFFLVKHHHAFRRIGVDSADNRMRFIKLFKAGNFIGRQCDF